MLIDVTFSYPRSHFPSSFTEGKKTYTIYTYTKCMFIVGKDSNIQNNQWKTQHASIQFAWCHPSVRKNQQSNLNWNFSHDSLLTKPCIYVYLCACVYTHIHMVMMFLFFPNQIFSNCILFIICVLEKKGNPGSISSKYFISTLEFWVPWFVYVWRSPGLKCVRYVFSFQPRKSFLMNHFS